MLPSRFSGGKKLKTEEYNDPISEAETAITTSQLMLAFGGLFLLNLLLRVFYIRYDFVNGDEGVRALTAVQMLEGARLYVDVVTDKPPGASFFYAAVFAMFGRSMKAVHLAATVWNFGTALIVYLIAARFYGRRVGLWAALLLVYFSTNYFTQDMMAANTELLMALPYSAAFFFFMVSSERHGGARDLVPGAGLILAGLLTGIATLFKQVGVLNLLFFAIYEVHAVWITLGDRTKWMASIRRLVTRLALIAFGFVFVGLIFVFWLKSTDALEAFWRNGVVLSRSYSDSVSFGSWIRFLLGRGLGYVFFNAALWSLAGWTVWRSLRQRHDGQTETDSMRSQRAGFDVVVALWCGVTLVAVMMGGRFFGHYFIPALPALSLLGARGLLFVFKAHRIPLLRQKVRVTAIAMGLMFSIGFLRCHHRTAVLAYETVTGTRTRWSADWGMTKREQEAEIVAQFLRDRVPAGEPLYIWGYAHDVFWRSGCRPASRYLTPYYIDGRFPDAEDNVPLSGEQLRREAAANLIDDLRRHKPRLILDVEGGLKALPHPQLVEFIKQNYSDSGSAGSDPGRPFRALSLDR